MQEKKKRYGILISLIAALALLLQMLGENLGISIDNENTKNIANSILGVLVVLGIVSKPTKEKEDTKDKTSTQDDEEEEKEDLV